MLPGKVELASSWGGWVGFEGDAVAALVMAEPTRRAQILTPLGGGFGSMPRNHSKPFSLRRAEMLPKSSPLARSILPTFLPTVA
jgi:hypothetical protein